MLSVPGLRRCAGHDGRLLRDAAAARWLALVLMAVALLASWPARAAAASTPAPPLRDYLVDQWTSHEGLPHNSLRDLAQTPDGFLWFATWEGLVRYDGLDFTVFSRASRNPTLPDNGVGALYVDPDGALWVSDSRGNLSRRGAEGGWRFWHSEGRWPRVLVHAMTMDRERRLWLLFEGQGLGCLHPDGRFEYFPPPPDVPLRASFPRLAIDGDGRLWIGGMDGLMVREPSGAIRRAPAAFGMSSGLAWPYRAPDGTVWLVAGQGVYRLRDGRPELLRSFPGLGQLTALLQDRRGELWIGSENRGLLRLGGNGLEAPAAQQARPDGRIVSLLEDAEGSVWIGANGGLFRYRETLFTRVDKRDGLSGDYVRAVFEDREGTLWVGGAGGLDRVRGGKVEPVRLRAGVPPSVLSLTQDRRGDLWVGAYGGEVFRLRDGRVVRRYGRNDDLPAGHIRALAPDPRGGVWAGTHHGPVRIVDDRIERPQAQGLPTGLVTALEVIDGALWIGSVEGASVLHDGEVRQVPLRRLGDARTVFGFRRIGSGTWIATDRGLYRERDGELRRVGLEQGLPVDTVFQIVPDRIGNAWITSNRGMLRVRMDTLEAVADGRRASLSPERFDESHGMSSSQGNGSSSPSAILRKDGTVWMATAAGVTAVDPERWSSFRQRRPPPAVIDTVRIDGTSHVPRDGEALPAGARISVTYLGLGFLAPERIRYRTRLEGFDPRWSEHGRQRSVEFVSLPPGDYMLRVAAAHPGGPWGAREARWRFTVQPHWWQRRGVQAGISLGVVLLVLAMFHFGIRGYRAANARLARQVEERTRALTVQTEQLLSADEENRALLDRLRAQSEAFERQAREDALTGLANRRGFDETLQREFARARRTGSPLCVLALDVDHFKAINDRHTHATGDAVLREVGALLQHATRACDLPARTGGEEFAIVLADASLDDAVALYTRLRGHLAARSQWGGVEGLVVTISGGAAAVLPGEEATSRLLRRADEALYAAKKAGRDRLHTA